MEEAGMKRILATKTPEKVGEKVKVSGWVANFRDHGKLIFVDIRDWSGTVQAVISEENKEAFEEAKKIGFEYVVSVIGEVVKREEKLINNKIPTGGIEISVEKFEIINTSKVLPFPLSDDGRDIDENLRLKYRFIDMRRKRVRDLMELRSKFILYTRNWFTDHGFTEIQTPILTVSSPEGARDFLVPSRLYPGKFYALPQAPQQYKQLLMVGGVDRYFQIAPCFRDEDPRADRHSGDFYQIDVECSFITQQEFFERVEPYFKDVIESQTNKTLKQFPFPQIPFDVAMDTYGSDKPDIRFEMKLTNLTEQFRESEMQIFKEVEAVRAILVDRSFSRKEVDDLTERIKVQGAKGLATINVKDGVFEGSLVKYFKPETLEKIKKSFEANGYEFKGEQTLFAVADVRAKANKLAGWLRSEMGTLLNLKDPNVLAFSWIVDFPMFEWSETEKRWDFGHNPFSMPQGGMKALLEKDPSEIKANQYDLACNGYEIASGSIRNHDPKILVEAFKITGYEEEETRKKFGHMISAFEYGAPPHGGFAPGVDRLMMIFFDETNIREVYAFPKTNFQELMTGAPSEIAKKDLDILGIKLADRGNEVFALITEKLKEKDVDYKVVEHQEARTSEDAAKFRGTQLSDGAKTVVLHSKEYPSKLIMIVIPADRQADIEKVKAIINEEVEVAPAEMVEKVTGLKVGAIPPFGRLLGMEVYFDKSFWNKETSAFNAGRRDRSIIMSTKDLILSAEPNKISKESDFTK